MCTVSMVMDDWNDRWRRSHPPLDPFFPDPVIFTTNGPTREEFDALKAELESLKKLLLAAKKYDEETGQPDCESDQKTALVKQLAKILDVDLSKIFTT